MAPAIPPSLARPHFIGIGGAGMSGVAKILVRRGATVTGSDRRRSAVTEALGRMGVTVHLGHAAEHLPPDADSVVVSSAIREDNPELAAARQRGLPVVHRSAALAALMAGRRPVAVAGTHGKTTTTSMLAVALRALGLDPSYAIGGDIDGPTSNAHHGDGDIFVAEADESDRSFHAYRPECAVVLNIELDHHTHYASLAEVHEAFDTFVGNVRPGGTLVAAADHPGSRELVARVAARRAEGAETPRVLTYGEAEDADVRIVGIVPHGMTSEVTVVLPPQLGGDKLDLTVSVPGRHYAHNAVAALTAGVAMGAPAGPLAAALASYTGARRRLQLLGTVDGTQVIDSYAHHPSEVRADLEAIRSGVGDGRLLVVFQPHLYSRTRELGAELGEALTHADMAAVLDIYPAREDPIPGVTSALVTEPAAARGAAVTRAESKEAAVELVAGMAEPGDVVLTMGAGDVTELGPRILTRLRRRESTGRRDTSDNQ